MISHCNCLKRAEWLKVEIEKKYAFKGIVIVDTAGVAKRRQARSKYGAKRPKDAK